MKDLPPITARLEEAIVAYRAALEEFTRARVPLDWATTQSNFGLALEALGEREAVAARLEEAAEAYQAALGVFEAANATYYVSIASSNLQRVEERLRERRASR